MVESTKCINPSPLYSNAQEGEDYSSDSEQEEKSSMTEESNSSPIEEAPKMQETLAQQLPR